MIPAGMLRTAWQLLAALQIALPVAAGIADSRLPAGHDSSANGLAQPRAGPDERQEAGSHPVDCLLCQYLAAHALAVQPEDSRILQDAAAGEPERIRPWLRASNQLTRPLPRAPPLS